MLGTAQLKTAIVRKLRAQFRTAAIPYVPNTWNTIIQSMPTVNTPYPYVHVEIDANDIQEVAVTAQGSSYDYFVGIKAVSRSEINADTRETRDALVAEIQRILDVDFDKYINLESKGFNLYVQTVESVNIEQLNELGTDIFVGDVILKVRMEQIGSMTSPTAVINETYQNFRSEPQNGYYELYDSGTVTMPTSYASSNGWIFDSVSYSMTSDSDGSVSGNIVTVGNTDNLIGISTTITFVSALDTSVTTTIFNRKELRAIKSPRIAVFTDAVVSNAQIEDLSLWTSRFPNVIPNRTEVEITANALDFIYIIVDEDHPLTGIKNDLGLDDIEEYPTIVQHGFNVYKLDTAIAFDNAQFEYTLISGLLSGSFESNDISVNVKILSTADSSLDINTANVIPLGMTGLLMPLPANPLPGDIVHVSNLSQDTTNEIQLNGNILHGLYSDNLVLDDTSSSFSLVFINPTLGWNIIGQN